MIRLDLSRIIPLKATPSLTAVFILFLGLLGAYAQQHPSSRLDWFDVPLQKKTMDFGPSWEKPSDSSPAWQWKAYQRARNTLTCYWFPAIMVKQYDVSEKGAAWISFMRVGKNEYPSCKQSHEVGEKVLAQGDSTLHDDQWWGYFTGVKGDFVFLGAADGENGGIYFTVYDSRTGKKVFEDQDCLSCMYLKKTYGLEQPSAPFNRMRVNKTPSGLVTLTYMRVEQADCDLRADEASCWDHVRIRMDVKSAKVPVCVGYDDTPVGRLPSMVAHPVFVSLESPPVVKSLDGPVLCWGVD